MYFCRSCSRSRSRSRSRCRCCRRRPLPLTISVTLLPDRAYRCDIALVVSSVCEPSCYLTYYIQPLILLYKLYQQVCKLSSMHNYSKFRIHLLSNKNALSLFS